MTNEPNPHPVDSATRRCCGDIGTHTRGCASSPDQLLIDAASPCPGTLRDVITAFADQMARDGAFAVLSPEDARVVTAIVAWEITRGDEAAGLRQRAAALLDGDWAWTDSPAAAAYAFTAAAHVLETL